MTSNHVIGSDRRKVSHQEYAEHLFKVASKLRFEGKVMAAKEISMRASLALRQPERECEICHPEQGCVS